MNKPQPITRPRALAARLGLPTLTRCASARAYMAVPAAEFIPRDGSRPRQRDRLFQWNMNHFAKPPAGLPLPRLSSAAHSAAHQRDAFIRHYDAGHDRRVTRAEFAAEHDKRFRTCPDFIPAQCTVRLNPHHLRLLIRNENA